MLHVYILKGKLGDKYCLKRHSPVNNQGQFLVEPVAILDGTMMRGDSKPVAQILVQWFNMPPEAAMWKDYDKMV